MAKQNIKISGQLLNKNNLPLAGLRVEAWDKDLLIDDFVGEAISDKDGHFKITFTQKRFKELFLDKQPDIYFKIYAYDKLIHSTESSVLWNVESDQENVEIIIDMPVFLNNNNGKKNIVLGKVTDSQGRPLANLKVAIYDVDMREWQALSDTFTNKDGKYELKWSHDQLSGRGKKEADIAIKVFTKEKNTELFKSSIDDVRFNASEREEINITIRQALPNEVVEFDFLVKEVSFLANKVAIADLLENKEHRDVTFLSKELEVPDDKIEHLVVAHRVHNLSKIDAAFFYAEKNEWWYCLEGKGILTIKNELGEQEHFLQSNAVIPIDKGIKYSFQNKQKEPLELIVINK